MKLIDQWSECRTGWARFSEDMTMRYRLARSLDDLPVVIRETGIIECERRVRFVLLNPSVADAFRLDPTVKRCEGFARALGADVYEVVNIFALRSTDPEKLYGLEKWRRGDGVENEPEIIAACTGAAWIVAGWGKHGALGRQGDRVRRLLEIRSIKLHHLGLNKDGSPKHPLYLKGGTELQEWAG